MPETVERAQLTAAIRAALRRSPGVALFGPRQVGKTTLARAYLAPESPNYFDLENPLDLQRLAEPMAALAPLRGLVVIDEVQRRPELFPALRVLMDREPLAARFLILGSASPSLLQQSSESLAGRLEIIDTPGFSLIEVGTAQLETLWTRGGFPRSFLAKNDTDSLAWRENFLRLTVERDLPGLGLGAPPTTVRRFWSMVAHYHGLAFARVLIQPAALWEASGTRSHRPLNLLRPRNVDRSKKWTTVLDVRAERHGEAAIALVRCCHCRRVVGHRLGVDQGEPAEVFAGDADAAHATNSGCPRHRSNSRGNKSTIPWPDIPYTS